MTRMILSAKEDLANDSLPAADGLFGEYAEKAIEEWAAQLRKGVQS
ncbi:Eae protein [Salmonella enterica subsp. arizonae]|uniref:Eae protein n=1 Tax=Salmonella enterica subsp. arizonae TaxID=59203 RepID=A0A379S5H4_SALER|nr:Eae protein [Salmonella enterica subsp. arizonae]